MILYHGSKRRFKSFKIDKKLAVTSESNLSEGYGIYMLANDSVAKNYKYTYQVCVGTTNIIDLSTRAGVFRVLSSLSTKTHIRLARYIDKDELVTQVLDSDVSVTGLGREVQILLDNSERFFNDYNEKCNGDLYKATGDIDKIYRSLLRPVIKYRDTSYKTPVYICFKKPEVLAIDKVTKNF